MLVLWMFLWIRWLQLASLLDMIVCELFVGNIYIWKCIVKHLGL